MPKSKPPRRQYRPNKVTPVRGRWLRGKTYDHYQQIILAIEDNNAVGVEWACRQLLADVRPMVEDDVAQARRAGATWQQIADGLEISTQAAHKRFHHLDAVVST